MRTHADAHIVLAVTNELEGIMQEEINMLNRGYARDIIIKPGSRAGFRNAFLALTAHTFKQKNPLIPLNDVKQR